MSGDDDFGLTEEEEESIRQSARDGILFSMNRNLRKMTGIRWVRSGFVGIPADRNALAEVIIKDVGTEEMPLDLDGNKYLIRKVE